MLITPKSQGSPHVTRHSDSRLTSRGSQTRAHFVRIGNRQCSFQSLLPPEIGAKKRGKKRKKAKPNSRSPSVVDTYRCIRDLDSSVTSAKCQVPCAVCCLLFDPIKHGATLVTHIVREVKRGRNRESTMVNCRSVVPCTHSD